MENDIKLPPTDNKEWKLGNLLSLNQVNYPALGSLFVQIWEGDSVVARVYGDSEEEVLSRANALLARRERSQTLLNLEKKP